MIGINQGYKTAKEHALAETVAHSLPATPPTPATPAAAAE